MTKGAKDQVLLESDESKFDVRLTDKKLEHGFMNRQELETYLKAIPDEKDFDVTNMDVVEQDDQPIA